MHYILEVSRYTNIVYIGMYFWKVQFQLSSTFFSFVFIWSANCASHIFSPLLLVSKLYELSLGIIEHILEMLYYCCLQKDQFVLFVPIQTFSWSVICTILVRILYLTILNLWPVLILEIFGCWDIKKGQFQFLFIFLAVFLWSVNCTNLVCILSYFEHRQCFI